MNMIAISNATKFPKLFRDRVFAFNNHDPTCTSVMIAYSTYSIFSEKDWTSVYIIISLFHDILAIPIPFMFFFRGKKSYINASDR